MSSNLPPPPTVALATCETGACPRTYESLTPAELKVVEKQCHDSDFSYLLMLPEKQTLGAQINQDRALLVRLGITKDQIADFLDSVRFIVYHAEKPEEWDPVRIGKFTFKWKDWRGAQECPFKTASKNQSSDADNYGCADVHCTNVETGEKFYFNTLHIHMIRTHEFFEGEDTYRVDPEKVVAFFGLQPGVDYKVYAHEHPYWCTSSSTSGGDFLRTSKEHPFPSKPEMLKAGYDARAEWEAGELVASQPLCTWKYVTRTRKRTNRYDRDFNGIEIETEYTERVLMSWGESSHASPADLIISGREMCTDSHGVTEYRASSYLSYPDKDAAKFFPYLF